MISVVSQGHKILLCGVIMSKFTEREWELIEQAVKLQRYRTDEYADLHKKIQDHEVVVTEEDSPIFKGQ